MRIVQINVSYGMADSTGRNVKELHEWLLKNNEDSYVFTTKLNDSVAFYDNRIKKFSNKIDQNLHAFLSRLTGLQGYFSYISTKCLITQLSRLKPEVIVLHVLHSNCINFKMLFSYIAKNNIGLVLVLHDCFYFTGHCCYYTDVNCNRWKEKCGNCTLKRKDNVSWFFDTSKKVLRDKKKYICQINKVVIIGVSEWISNEAKNSILKVKSIRTIYNWIDFNIFYPRTELKYVKKQKKKVALAVASNWTESKGLHEIQQLAKEHPEIVIILVGNISKTIKAEKNMMLVGNISNAHILAEYYSIADVFVNPSKQETFGKTTAESLSCGTPVVAYEVTACKELVSDERGKLVELQNERIFLNAVIEVINNGKEIYTQNCIQFAKNNFSKQDNLMKYYKYIKKMS